MSQSAPAVQGHRLKKIITQQRDGVIVLQDANGPCPLLAIVNVLLVRGKLNFHPDYSHVTNDQLLATLADYLLANRPALSTAEQNANYERNVSDAIQLLPKLQRGLDVNVKFGHVSQFEFSAEMLVFDLFNIKLRHGWVVDPAQTDQHRVLHALSYNQAVERVIAGKSKPNPDAELVERFLTENPSQLTWYGLQQLHADLADGESVVLFRANHFCTLVKIRSELYVLCTDVGFFSEPFSVWEKLSTIDGDTSFYDANFQLFRPTAASAAVISTVSPIPPMGTFTATVDKQTARDAELARQLHDEEVQRLQQQQQQQQQQKHHPQQMPTPSDNQLRSSSRSHGQRDRDSDCVLL